MTKQISFTLLILTLSLNLTVNGQTPEEVEIIQNVLGLEKRVIVDDIMQLEVLEVSPFWDLYDEYEIERKEIAKAKIRLIQDYARNYFDLNDDKADEMFKRFITIEKNRDKLLIKYYGKIKKDLNAKIAAQFFQLENYFVDVVNVQLANYVPAIGELNE